MARARGHVTGSSAPPSKRAVVKCVASIVTRVVNTGPWRAGAPWGKVLRSRCGVAPTQATRLTAAPA
jgi:hypothetical protein